MLYIPQQISFGWSNKEGDERGT